MKSATLLLLLILIEVQVALSQVKVPVLCDGKIVEKEYKTYDECNCTSWAIDYYENSAKGGKQFNKSRSKVIELADYWCQRWAKSDGKTYTHSEPYCDDGKLCGSLSKNFLNAIKSSLKEFNEELDKLKNIYYGIPIVKRSSPGLVGYLRFIQRAVKASEKAYNKTLEYQKNPLKEIENALNIEAIEISKLAIQTKENIIQLQKIIDEGIADIDSVKLAEKKFSHISKKQLADDEKLNQALMKKLEKDFDEEHHSKNDETITTSKSSCANNSTKIGNASGQNTFNYKTSQTSTKKYTFFTWQNNNGSVFNLYLSKVVEFTDESWDSVWKSMQEKFKQYMKLRGIYFSGSDQVNHFPAVETREAATKLKQSTITKHASLFGSKDSRSSLSFEIN